MSRTNGAEQDFLRRVNEYHLSGPLPDDGEACMDLFAINSARKTASTHLTTGCLPFFADDVAGSKHTFATLGTPSAEMMAGDPAVPEKRQTQKRKRGAKRPASETQYYPKAEEPSELTVTRGGRVTKRALASALFEDDSALDG